MSKTDSILTSCREKYMHAALELAREAAAGGEIPVGCVIVGAGGEILGTGRNRRETDHDATAHAEMEAIREACRKRGDWRLENCTLYVTLEPCPMCASALVMSRLPFCVFGTRDPQKGCFGSVYDFAHDPLFQSVTEWDSGTMEKACREQLQAFFRRRRSSGKNTAEPVRTDAPDA